MHSLKQEAIDLINHMPDEFSWDDLMYEIYSRKKIEMGLQAVIDGRVISLDESKKRLLSL